MSVPINRSPWRFPIAFQSHEWVFECEILAAWGGGGEDLLRPQVLQVYIVRPLVMVAHTALLIACVFVLG